VSVLVVLTKDKHDFNEEEIEFAKILAAQAGLAVANARLYWRNQQLAQELLSSQSHVGKLVAGLINAHDEEAKSIARVLHDESGQLLAGVHISLDETAKQLPELLKLQIDHAKKLLDQVEERLRHLSHELYPPILDNLGLVPSLEFLAEQISKRKDIKITIETRLNRRIAPLLELTLYRVVQEALNNVNRHARASKVHVRLVESERLVRCSIRDNGVGFNIEAVSKTIEKKQLALDLAGMRERVAAVDGTFQIISVPGCGTQLLVTVPLSGRRSAQNDISPAKDVQRPSVESG
jgi:two-component system sensor histidine kinase DegS